MKEFFHKYSYSIVKMFLNQFGISVFGSVLAMATTSADNNTLTVIVSIAAVIFYLFLLYTMTWEIGAKDRISVDTGKVKYSPCKGLLLSLIANIPNLLIAILFSIGFPFMGTHTWAGNLCAFLKLALIIIEGMYLGLLTVIQVPYGGAMHPLNYFWWPYFLIVIPAMLTCWIAYYFGHKNIKFTSLFDYKDPNQNNAKKK